jgi:hypothetical protein
MQTDTITFNETDKSHNISELNNCIPLFVEETNKQKFNCICVNIRSIRKNWDQLQYYINPLLLTLQMIVLLEININESESSSYSLPGYESIFRCRENCRGGGIAVFYKNVHLVRIDSFFSAAETELFRVTVDKTHYSVLVVYRPPNKPVNNFINELDNWLALEATKKIKNLIVMGDINLCYRNHHYGADNYVDVINSHGLSIHIQTPTREEILNNNITSTTLDHINSRIGLGYLKTFVIQQKIADHYFIGFSAIITSQINYTQNKDREINVISNKLVDRYIHTIDWNSKLNVQDPNRIYEDLISKFDKLYRKSTIKIKCPNSNRMNPWINNEIKANIIRKDNLWKELKNNRNNREIRILYNRHRNQLTNMIRKEKRKFYYEKFISITGDIRKTWALIDELIGRKKQKTILQKILDNFQTQENNLHNIANNFNTSFSENITKLNSSLTGQKFQLAISKPNLSDSKSLLLRRMSIQSLLKSVNKLNTSSSPGPDNISPKHIKNNINVLKHILVHFFNTVFITGVIPKNMKLTYLRPIYKSGRKNDYSNYRPIGAVSVLMKIMETYVTDLLNKYAIDNKILSDTQYGFVPGRSSIDLLEKIVYGINNKLHSGNCVVGVALDLSKAFDTVQYGLLLDKLQSMGVNDRLYRWFKNYFSERQTCVKIGTTCGEILDQSLGLIQGSIVAPLLFNLYVSDLANLNLKGSVYQYADDTILIISRKDLHMAIDIAQQDLNLIIKYFFNHKIHINAKKTKTIVFHNPRITYDLCNNVNQLKCHGSTCFGIQGRCDCAAIKHSTTIKHLGLYIDSDMKFQSHINHLRNILRILIHKLYNMNHYPLKIKRTIYFSLVESHMRYGITMYSLAPDYIMSPLKSLLARIQRNLFMGLPMNLIGILDYDNLVKYVLLCRHYFDINFRKSKDRTYNIRPNSETFLVPRHYNTYGQGVLEYIIPKLLNSLPIELQQINNKNQFKYIIRTYLQSEYT